MTLNHRHQPLAACKEISVYFDYSPFKLTVKLHIQLDALSTLTPTKYRRACTHACKRSCVFATMPLRSGMNYQMTSKTTHENPILRKKQKTHLLSQMIVQMSIFSVSFVFFLCVWGCVCVCVCKFSFLYPLDPFGNKFLT